MPEQSQGNTAFFTWISKTGFLFVLFIILCASTVAAFVLPMIASAATGEVQFSVLPAYQFGTAGSFSSNGNTIAKLFDGDLTSWWDAPIANGGYAGVDLTTNAQVTSIRIAPRISYTSRLPGTLVQGATVSSSTGPWTTLLTIPSYPPYFMQKQYNEIPINTNGAYYRYYRIVPPNGYYGSIGELRFIGIASGTTPYIPAQPIISPLGGKYAMPMQVTITSSTTDATLYYTTDGTTPTFSGGVPQGTTRLYTGPFIGATSAGTTTVQAIAVSAGTYVSDVSLPAYFFISPSFRPLADWYDTTGRLIEGHDGTVSYLNGKYYWYGENLNNSGNEVELLGLQAYSSTDLLNWKNEGLIFNTNQAYKIRRPQVIYNATSGLYVLWARNANPGRFVIATSTTPIGPFNLATSTYNTPSGYGNNDINIFQESDGTAYVTFVTNDTTKIVIYKLASDYLSVTGSAFLPVTITSRDAPAMFKRGNVYFMMTSGQNNWISTTVKYATTTNPLSTWSALVNPFQVATEDNTTGYNSIVSDVFKVNGRSDGYVYAGERYDSSIATSSLYNSRALWLPITFPTAGTMSISWQQTWDLDTAFATTTAPLAATNFTATTNGPSEVDLSWTNNETAGTSLYLDRASDGGFVVNQYSRLLAAGTTTAIDTNVSTGNVYYYRLRTVNGAGSSVSATGIANYSTSSDVLPPSVSLLAPSTNATIIGKNVLLSASSSDNIGIASVKFYVDSTFVGTSTSTTSPNNFIWDSTGTSDGAHTIRAVAFDGANNAATSTGVVVQLANNVPFLFTSTSTVLQNSTSTITLTGNATSWTPGTPGSPTFTVSGGAGASIVSQSVSSATTSTIVLGAGRATTTLLITDPLSGATSSLQVAPDTIAPLVSFTAPSNGATLIGTTTLTASTSDNVAVASVQFKLDGTTNIGSAGTSSPYSLIWNTASTTNGSHTVSIFASDYSGNQSSTSISVIVNNSNLPGVTSATSTNVSYFTAQFNGSITNDGGASSTARGFIYGLTTSYGATTTESGVFGIGTFSTSTVVLSCASTYHYKAYATNLTGTAYGVDKVFTTLTCPTATSTGEIQFSVSPAYQFGLTPSYLNLGHVPSFVFDGDTSSWWDTAAANGAYVGLDLTVPGQVTRMRIAPRPGYTIRPYGAVLQGSNATSAPAGPWTSIYTIASFPPFYDAQRQLNELPINTGGATYRYYRLVMPNGTNGTLAEFRLIGLPGTTTPYLPVPPEISPRGGKYDLPTKVRLSSLTTDAALYYTTDGTAPTFINGAPQGTTQLYTGPFVVSNAATTTVQAIAVSKGQYVSELSTQAQFYINTDNKPSQDWLDLSGHLIESHGGGINYFNGKYYWYGQIFNANDPENESVGLSCYSSPDLINWTDEGPIIYLGRTDIVERPHVIYNDTTHKYVMWAHNIISYPNSRAYVATSDTPSGPFTIATTTLNPDGQGLNDMTLYKDTDGTGYVIYSNGTNTHFIISQLSPDYLSTTGTFIMPGTLVNHEAPAMFKRNGVYYLLMSQVTGWAPNQNVYATSTSPLGTWSATVNPFQPSAFQDYTTTYGSQVTSVVQVPGRTDAFIYIGDRFDNTNYLGGSLYNSRHIQLPIKFDARGNLSISWYNNWNLDTAFGTTTLPLAATGLSVTKLPGEVDLSWTNNATTSYSLFVDRATDSAFTQNVVSDAVTSTTTTYVDTYNYNQGTTYYYRIRTLTADGTSNSVVVATYATPPSTLATPVMATSTDTGISNTDNITNNITPVLQGTASSSALIYVLVNSTVLGTTTASVGGAWSYSVPSTTPDGVYTFRVVQQVGGVQSATSSALSISILTSSPTVSLSSASSSPISAPITVSGIASTGIYGLTLGAFSATNGATVSALSTTSSTTFSVLLTPTTTGTTTLTLGSSKYTDIAGNTNTASSTFTVYADLTGPLLSSSSVNGTNVALVFSKSLNTATPAASSFAVLVNGATTTPSSVSVATSTVYLTLSSAVYSIDTIRLTYTPGVNPIRDTLGNQASGFSGTTLTNNTAAIVPATLSVPTLATSTDTGVSNTDNITNNITPTLQGMASSSALVYVIENGSVIGTTTASAGGSWSYVVPSITPDGTYTFRAVQQVFGIQSATSSALSVTILTSKPTAILSSASSSPISAPITISGTASTGIYGLTLGAFSATNGATVSALSTTSSTTFTVLLTPTTTGTTTLTLGVGQYTDVAGNSNSASSTFTTYADLVAPVLSSGTVNGTSIVLNFSKSLNTAIPAASNFAVLVNGATTTPSSVLVATSTVYLTLSSAVHSIDVVRLTYTPGVNPLKDTLGNQVTSFAGYLLTNTTVGIVPSTPGAPSLATSSDSGISSSDNITNNITPTIQGTASSSALIYVLENGTVLSTTTANGSGAWSYVVSALTPDGSYQFKAVQQVFGIQSATSSALTITILTSAPPATLSSASSSPISAPVTVAINGGNQGLYGLSLSSFSATNGATVSSLATTSSSTFTVVLNPANTGTTTLTLGAGRYTDVAGNYNTATTTFSIYADLTGPVLTSSSVSGTRAVLLFSKTLNTATPAASSFAVLVNGATTTPSLVSVATSTVYITLPSQVHATDIVTLSYTPGVNPLQDTLGNMVATFAGASITNNTPFVIPATLAAPTLATSTDTGISNTDNITNNITPTLQGVASSSALVYVLENGTVLGTTTANGGGAWSYSVPALTPDGVYQFKAVQQVFGAQSATSSALSITVLTLAPSATLSSASSSPISAPIIVSGIASTGIYGLTLGAFSATNGAIVSSLATTSSSTFSVLLTPTTTGTTTLTLGSGQYSDVAGNTNTASSTFTTYADLVAPVLVSSVVNGANVALVFSKSLNTTTPAASSFAVLVNGATTTPSSVSVATSTVHLTLSSAVHSIDTVRVTYTPGVNPLQDTLGNQVSAFAGATVTNNTIAIIPQTPSATTLASASDSGISSSDNITNVATPTIQGTASSSALIYVLENGTVLGTTTANGGGAWSYVVPTLTPDGVYLFKAVQQVHGIQSATSSALSVTLITSTPLATLSSTSSSPVAGPVIVRISGNGGTGLYGLSLSSFSATNGATVSLLATTSSSTFTVLLTPTTTGTTTLTLGANKYTDFAGNNNTATSTFSIYADLTPPSFVSGTIDTSAVSLVFSKVLNTTAPISSSIAVLVNGATTTPDSISISGSTVNITVPTVVHSIDTVQITYIPGANPLQDTLGNLVTGFANIMLTNNTAVATVDIPYSPTLASASDSGISSSDGITNITTPTIQGTASSSALITIVENGNVIGTTTSAGNGAWSFIVPSLVPDGTYLFSYTQTLFGVTSATSSTLSVRIDTTSPALSINTPADSSTINTWSTVVSWNGSALCAYSLDSSSYTSTDCSLTTLGIARPSVGAHTLVIRGTDAVGNRGYATSTFTYTPLAPVISSVHVAPSDTSALFTWNTDNAASTQVLFGLSPALGVSTGEIDTVSRVTTHSIAVGQLIPCTLYHYELQSTDAIALTSTTSDATFITTGCTGSASVSADTTQTISNISGGSTALGNLTLTVPPSFSDTQSVVFQAKQIDSIAFFATASTPSGVEKVGTSVINLKALADASSTITSFNVPLTVTLSYSPSDIAGLDEMSLAIYRYDGSSWFKLSGCLVDTAAHTVTCQTSHFSDFALFGTPVSSPPTPPSPSPSPSNDNQSSRATTYSSSGGSGFTRTSKNAIRTLVTMPTQTVTTTAAATAKTATATSTTYEFKRTLSVGSVGEDVRQLQKYLNDHGFVIALKGAGSKGHETDTFGTKTKMLLLAFQKKHGIKGANGVLGPATMKYLNSHK